MLPGILNQLGAESLSSLKKLASTVAGGEFLRKYKEYGAYVQKLV